MRVLVTGGLGYLGWVVAARLAERGDDVVALSSGRRAARVAPPPGVAVVAADLCEPDQVGQLVRAGRYGGVCHLAGLTRVRDSFADPEAYWQVNAGGTANLLSALAAARGEPPRFVLASTAAVLGDSDGTPLAEDHRPAPANPYGASKLAAEASVASAAAAGRVAGVVLRPFSVAGAYGRHRDTDLSRILPKALAVAAGQAPHVQINGDGSAVREFTHVADLADAFALALDAARPGGCPVYHAGTGQGVTVARLLSVVEEVTGRPVATVHRPAAREARAVLANPTRIRDDLRWRPARSDLGRIVADAWAAVRSEG